MALTKDISCHDAVALVSDYLEGALSMRQRRRLERHLANCAACSAYLDQMRATVAATGTIGPEDLAPDVLDGLMDLFDRYQRDSDE